MTVTARAIVGLMAAALAATMGMGTDSRVEARLNGTTTSSGWVLLDNPGDDRKRGRTDVYDKTLTDIGTVTSVDIYFANNNDSPHWCLEEITVRRPDGVTTIHPFHNWLTRVYSKNAPLRLPAA